MVYNSSEKLKYKKTNYLKKNSKFFLKIDFLKNSYGCFNFLSYKKDCFWIGEKLLKNIKL